MAEGAGIEPAIPDGKPRLSKPAQYRSASLPMVGRVGVEPTISPRSERGAFTSLTTARWCRRSDSNRHCTGSRPADSANWPTSAYGPSRWTRTSTDQGLSLTPLPIGLATDGAGRRNRTCTGPGLSRLLLPVERVQRAAYLEEGGRFELPSRLRGSLFSRQVRCAIPLNPPSARTKSATTNYLGMGEVGTSTGSIARVLADAAGRGL
jgi:hypothetical protein